MFGLFGSKKRAVKKAEAAARKEEKAVIRAEKRVEKKVEKKGQKFGGYTVDFKDQNTTLEDLFGKKPVTTPEMTKKLWTHIKKNKLGGR